MKPFVSAVAATLAMAGSLAASETPVEKVDVAFDVQAVESETAATFWADLEGDLEAAILAKVADRIEDHGSEISIDIDEFDMSNNFQGAIGVDSVLTASIEVRNEEDPSKNGFFDLRVSVDEAAKLIRGQSGAEIVTHDRDDVYQAMVETFADGVVKRLR